MSTLKSVAAQRISRLVLVTLLMNTAIVVAGTATPALAVTCYGLSAGKSPQEAAQLTRSPSPHFHLVQHPDPSPQGRAMPRETTQCRCRRGTCDIVFTPGVPFQAVTRSSFAVTSNQTLDVVLVQEGISTLSGRLVDSLGVPVSVLNISLYDPVLGSFNGQSGTDGRFVINAKNGSYRLGVNGSANNAAIPRNIWQLATANQSFALTANTDVGDFALPATVCLNVTVIDPASQSPTPASYPKAHRR